MRIDNSRLAELPFLQAGSREEAGRLKLISTRNPTREQIELMKSPRTMLSLLNKQAQTKSVAPGTGICVDP